MLHGAVVLVGLRLDLSLYIFVPISMIRVGEGEFAK
jgi:hypothetical protein